MSKIHFNTLKITGFAGIQPLTIVKLDEPGLNVITGPNGATKTTRFSALVWCLYGKALKEKSTIETYEHLRTDDYQGTHVQVSFYRMGSKYTVVRCKNYQGLVSGAKGANRLVVEKNGELLWPKLKDKRDIQPALTSLLGFSFNLFINSIIFPQKVTRFIETSGPARKQVLEESFKMLWINAAARVAQEEQRGVEQVLSQYQGNLQGYTDAKESLDKILTTMAEAKVEFEETQASTIKRLGRNLKKLRKKSKAQAKSVKPILDTEAGLIHDRDSIMNDPKYKARTTLSVEVNQLINKREASKKLIKKYASDLIKAQATPLTSCPECGQPLPKKDSSKFILTLKTSQKEEDKTLAKLKNDTRNKQVELLEANKLAETLQEIQDDLSSIQEDLIQARETNLLIEGAKGRMEEMNKQLTQEKEKVYQDPSGPVKIKLFEEAKKITRVDKLIKKTQAKIDLYKWVIQNPLGSNGIKAFMFSHLVELVNYQLAVLEKHTTFGVTLVVEGSGVRKNIEAIVSRRGFPVSYHDLSGGESNLVNVMISLAIGEVVTLEQPVNIRIFDESFEGLDAANVEVVANLLSHIQPETSLFVITHKVEFNPQNCNRIILEKLDE